MDDHTTHLQSLKGLVASINELNVLAEQEYTPIVEEILRSCNHDTKQIENALGGLFDFCGYEPVLLLFKRLCRYYYDIDPAATINYIHHYRDYWNAETRTPSASATSSGARVAANQERKPCGSACTALMTSLPCGTSLIVGGPTIS